MDLGAVLVGDDALIPKERYTSAEFLALEMERLWSRVWQVACREEEIAAPGDHLEYTIGDQSILVVRTDAGDVAAYYNTCCHRGTRLASGCGHFDAGTIRCPYHGWCYGLDGRVSHIPDEAEFGPLPELRLGAVRTGSWGGFVFVSMDPDAPPLLEFLDPIPTLLGAYHLERMRFRSYQTTVVPANWKALVDAFNEGYHVQGTHPQILPWTDDVSIAYEQYRTHARYGRLEGARRQLRPSPRLGLEDGQFDEAEILAGLVAGLGGAFLGEERALVDRLRAEGPPAGLTLLEAYQQARLALLRDRGVDVDGFTAERMTSAEDVFWFPNLVGPIYPGSAILFRARPDGIDPDQSIHDVWTLAWPADEDEWKMPERRVYPDCLAKDWGPIANQDYANLVEVQVGMHSRGCTGLRVNPRQEGNILHMHRVIDRYLTTHHH